MDLRLVRVATTNRVTPGTLYVDGALECVTLEDAIREQIGVPVAAWKIPGETAIPAGRYDLTLTMSQRFQRILPLLGQVPGFTGVRIHAGNVIDDTEGCILPGLERRPDGVGESKLAVIEVNKWFDAIIAKGQEAWITVQGPELEAA